MPQEISSNEIAGIAKKFNAEIEQFPMHTHSAIVEVVRVLMQHRNLVMQAADRDEANARQERVLKMQEAQMDIARRAAEQRDAEKMAPHLVNAAELPPS